MPDDIVSLAEGEALTAEEVAQLLQVSRNTVYNLVKRDELASYHVGRKMRFTHADVQNYIARARGQKAAFLRESGSAAGSADALGQSAAAGDGPTREAFGGGSAGMPLASARDAPGMQPERRMPAGGAALTSAPRPSGAHAQAAPGYVIAGNDILGDMIANYLGAVEVPIRRVYEGSYRALMEAYFGNAQAALAHIYDGPTGTYNVPAVQRLVPGLPLAVVRLAKRRQGLIVKRGNPKGLRSWEDLLRPGVRIANREKGCGSRILLDEKLARLGVRRDEIEGYDREFPSALTMASLVARGGADAGVGAERVFHQVEGVDFLPLQDEWLDIVLIGGVGSNRVAQAIVRLARTRSFRAEVAAIAGYDTSHMGEVVYEQ